MNSPLIAQANNLIAVDFFDTFSAFKTGDDKNNFVTFLDETFGNFLIHNFGSTSCGVFEILPAEPEDFDRSFFHNGSEITLLQRKTPFQTKWLRLKYTIKSS